MSKAIRCDRCGKFYTFKDVATTIDGVPFFKLGMIGADGRISSRSFDLCNDCKSEFNIFMIAPGFMKNFKEEN